MGYLLRRIGRSARSALRAGTVTLGKPEGVSVTGVRGWFDELKVLSGRPDPETVCTHAHGTLVTVTGASPGWLRNLASAYPAAHHSELRALGVPSASSYACWHDYALDRGILSAPLPRGSERIGPAAQFPEGPVLASSPRPDSTSNAFCLSCHSGTDANAPDSLSRFRALGPRRAPARNDPRRQPTQPPRVLSGHLPAGLLGPDAPTRAASSNTGFLIDLEPQCTASECSFPER